MSSAEADPALAALCDEPLCLGLLRYWDEQRRGRAMPDRRDIDPAGLGKRLLPSVLMVDILDDGGYRFRLVGSEIVARLGCDPTGRRVDELLEGAYLDHVLSLNRQLIASRAPVFSESVHRWDSGGWAITRRLVAPLTNGGDAPSVILGVQSFRAPEDGPIWPRIRALSPGEVEQLRSLPSAV